jgi:hypothetical protein
MKLKTLKNLLCGLFALSASSAFGIVNVTNFTVTSSTVSFDIYGEIDLRNGGGGAKVPVFTRDTLYIWDKSGTNGSWIISNTSSFPRTVIDGDDSTQGLLNTAGGAANGTTNDRIILQTVSQFSNGDFIDASVSFVGGSFSTSGFTTSDLIVSWGSDGVGTSPELTQIGEVYEGAVVPEPNTYGLLLAGAVFAFAASRRR